MTNAKVHQGFCEDKKIEKHCSTVHSTRVLISMKKNTE